MTAGGQPQRWRVTCDAPYNGGYGSQPPCRFDGYRTAGSAEEAGRKPCPRCGGPVQVTPRPVRAKRTSAYARGGGALL